MTRIRRARPALVVVVLALIAAVAGTALAGPEANTAGTRAKKALEKANRALKKTKKNKKAIKNIGTSAAFAQVNPSGNSVVDENSHNVTDANVTRRQTTSGADLTGQTCIHDLSFRPRSAAVTPGVATLSGQNDRDAVSSDRIASASLVKNVAGCPSNTSVLVTITDVSANVPVDAGFVFQFRTISPPSLPE